jgi:hypothetical protein
MKKIEQYTVLTAPDSFSLAAVVGRAILDGWQPFGGVSHDMNAARAGLVGTNGYPAVFAQAMVIYAKAPTKRVPGFQG